MFQTIKDAYDKYITMDYRISALEERIKELESRIQPQKDVFSCRVCDTGRYKPNGKKRTFHGLSVGDQWQCDKCGHIADELLSQKLSKS